MYAPSCFFVMPLAAETRGIMFVLEYSFLRPAIKQFLQAIPGHGVSGDND
jgi:hypothetical protein